MLIMPSAAHMSCFFKKRKKSYYSGTQETHNILNKGNTATLKNYLSKVWICPFALKMHSVSPHSPLLHGEAVNSTQKM